MKAGPVDSSIVALEDVLDYRVGIAEQICLTLVGSSNLLFERHRSLVRLVLLSQTGDIPNPDGQVH